MYCILSEKLARDLGYPGYLEMCFYAIDYCESFPLRAPLSINNNNNNLSASETRVESRLRASLYVCLGVRGGEGRFSKRFVQSV